MKLSTASAACRGAAADRPRPHAVVVPAGRARDHDVVHAHRDRAPLSAAGHRPLGDMPPESGDRGPDAVSDGVHRGPGSRAHFNDRAVQPVLAVGAWSIGDGITAATPPLREFMLKHTRQTDLALFVEISKTPRPSTAAGRPADARRHSRYAISELKTGFQMGFFVFVPFLLIDLVVSTTLLSMGMLQLPPAMIPAAVQAAALRHGRRLESHRYLGRAEFRVRAGRRGLSGDRVRLTHSWWALSGRPSNWLVLVSLPMLLAGLVAGILVSMFQTVTSIQDNVLAFIPASRGHLRRVFALTFPWMLRAERFHAAALRAVAGAHPVIDFAQPRVRLGILLVRPGVLSRCRRPSAARFAPARVKVGLIVLIAIALAPYGGGAPVDRAARADWCSSWRAKRPSAFALALALRVLIAGAEAAGSPDRLPDGPVAWRDYRLRRAACAT